MKRFTAKLGNMRKAKDWIVYPRDENPTVIVQCNDRIAAINPETKKAILSKSTTNPGFIYLNPKLGATVIDVPEEIIALALGAEPKPGEEIGPGVFLAPQKDPLDRLAALGSNPAKGGS